MGDALGVQDEGDSLVPQYGGAAVDPAPLQAGREGFHQDFLAAQDAIHPQGEETVPGAEHQPVGRGGKGGGAPCFRRGRGLGRAGGQRRGLRGLAQELLEHHGGDHAVSEPQDPGISQGREGPELFRRAQAQGLVHVGLGEGEVVRAAGHQQRREHRQGEGQADTKGGPFSGGAVQVHAAPQALHVVEHHVHSHPSPGDGRDGGGGGKSRMKYKAADLVGGHLADLPIAGQAAFQGPGPDAIQVQSPAVVGDVQVHPPPPGPGLQGEGSRGGLACGDTFVGGFQAVIQGISHQMYQRISQGFQQRPIQLHLAPLQGQADAFSQRAG
ncbi:MAG: hypothetical protein BWY88_01162 [Synergistetes bacterium ADurb.Bin520]|nr:MAG: hypothetical protein BWY88_01162 [Synergistetes bacterium ADurb.Bin520]